MAYTAMAYIAMACIAMAYTIMAYVVMVYIDSLTKCVKRTMLLQMCFCLETMEHTTAGALQTPVIFFCFTAETRTWHRWRESGIGRSEEINPALWALVPLQAETSERLVQMFENQPRLTTIHDVRRTLVQIPCLTDSSPDSPGLDLLADAIPANRTCAEAAVPLKYCPFVTDVPMDRAMLSAHADKIFAAWENYTSSVMLKHERFYDECESLSSNFFELARATSCEAGKYRIVLQRQPELKTEFAIEAVHLRPDRGGSILIPEYDSWYTHSDRWTVVSASRTTSYAHETCHSRLPRAAWELCLCKTTKAGH